MSEFINSDGTTKLYGKYRAIVLSLKDPEYRGRVLVKSPKVLNHHTLGWAESCLPPGYFFLPRVNDTVWIEFEQGDVHKPVWTGIMPSRQYVRDFIMRNSNYPTNKAFIINPQGGIDVVGQYLYNSGYWTNDKT